MSVTIAVLSLLAATAHAAPKPNLVTSISAPASTHVYDDGRYTVSVTNTGNATATGVWLRVQLPETHTSPQVYVLGDLGASYPGCTVSGTEWSCYIGQLKKGKTATRWFDIALPWAAVPLEFESDAECSGTESNGGDNTDLAVADLFYEPVSISTIVDTPVDNFHCTGTDLIAWFECTKFPSSISQHPTTLLANGDIDVAPGYTGNWWQTSPEHLEFEYYDAGNNRVLYFEGDGVDGDCFEGLTTFDNSSYVAPYLVCR